jgi:hypothetical protein
MRWRGPSSEPWSPLFQRTRRLPKRLLGRSSRGLRRSPELWCWHCRDRLRRSGGPHRTPHLPAVGFLFVELFGEVCGANIFVAHALGHDAVVESDNGVAAALFREPRIPAAFRCLRRGPLD